MRQVLLGSLLSDFNHTLPKTPKVYEAREKPERGTPLGLIRKPLAEPRMEPIRRIICGACSGGLNTSGDCPECEAKIAAGL
jgi:hypothetical protein